MISYRKADLVNTILKPRPFYLSYDEDKGAKYLYDPKTKQYYWANKDSDERFNVHQEDVLIKFGDEYVLDDQFYKNRQTWIQNDYIGEYSHIDLDGNFVFKDSRLTKFADKKFSVRDWVLTDNHERGLHLERRV